MVRNTAEFMGIPDELFYWIPEEMVVVVRLPRIPADDIQEMLVEQIRLQLNGFLAHYNISLEPYGTLGRWSTSPAMPPIRRRSFLFGLQRKQPLIAIFFHTRYLDNRGNDPLPTALSHIQSHLEELAQLGLQVVSAMPNWVVTAAAPPLFYSHGGSALPARPAPGVDVPSSGNALLGWHTTLHDNGIPLDAKGGEDVLVAILDTAHHPDRIRSAATRLEHRRNWLLQRLSADLRDGDDLFTIEYNRYPLSNDVRTGRDNLNDARYYLMPDHGLSVAGLIRDVAPRAKIRLVRILNDYGGSDLYTLFAALTDLEREIVSSSSLRKVIINLSLTIMPDLRRLPYIWLDNRQWPSTQLAGVIRILSHIEEGLRLLCEALYARGVLIVAAAGNDSLDVVQQGLRPRPPRAPARYETTLSVASVNSRFTPSLFANAANLPTIDSGVATFGGDAYGITDPNGLPDAVRGIYISPTFPNGEQNTSGWADLAGSSFSAPIVSGLAAHLMGQGWSASNIIMRLSGQDRRSDAFLGVAPDAPTLLANIIKVQQRYGM